MDKIVGVGRERIGKDGKKRILVYWRPAKGMAKVFRWVEAETRLDAHYKRQKLIAGYDGSDNDSSLPADFSKALEELKRTLEGDNRPKKTVQLYTGTFNRVFVDFKKVYEAKHRVSITSLFQIEASYIHEFKDYYTIDLKRKWRAEIIRIKSILTKLRMKKFIEKDLLYDVREELHTPTSEPLPYLNIPDTELEKIFSYIKQHRIDYYRPYRYMYLTGRRPGETSLYEKRDVIPTITDPEELHIRKEITKTKKDSVIYLTGELKTLIQDSLRGNSTKWLFPNRHNRKCWKDGLYKYLRRVSKKVIGVQISPRYFRKRFHTKKIPISMRDAMSISGLKDTRVAMEHYAYSTPEGQAKILAKTK